MRDDLMAIKVEVDPVGRATTFGTPQQFAVERARCLDAVDGECDMEREKRGIHDDGGFQKLKEFALHQASRQHVRHNIRE
jgi:hypothetical protein